ncbi:MAG: Wzz/FepE/Etk N-terminal domain-containing protein, partial [Methylotenera sp.]
MENQANQAVAPHPMQQPEDDEINLMELLLVIAKHNRFILKLTVFVAVLALAVSLLLPNIYTGKTVILPPQQG